MKRSFIIGIFVLAFAFFLPSCVQDDTFSISLTNGVIVTNEGSFNAGNGEISFLHFANEKVSNDLFLKVNSRPLGDVVQSATLMGDRLFIVVNNSGKVEVTNAETLKSLAVIENLNMPRYILQVNDNKAYISTWGNDGELLVLDIQNYTITKRIAVGQGAEQMVKVGNKVFVSNSGGFSNANTVSVINADTDAVSTEIEVGYNPKSLVVDKNNNVWVLCGGKWLNDYSGLEVAGKLLCINSSDNSVVKQFSFPLLSSMPEKLNINPASDKLIYSYNSKVYSIDIEATELPTTEIITGYYNAFAFRPSNGKLYVAEADYQKSSKVLVFDSNFLLTDTFFVGIAPNGFIFVD